MKTRFLFVLLVAISLHSSAQKHTHPRALWFTDARFGMFIHWGVYSGAEGIWKGENFETTTTMPNGFITGTGSTGRNTPGC